MKPILEYLVCFAVSVFLITGIISLSVLTCCCKKQRICQSLIRLTEHDTDAEFIIKACLRTDRLIGRTLPPIIIVEDATDEVRQNIENIAARLNLEVITPGKAKSI